MDNRSLELQSVTEIERPATERAPFLFRVSSVSVMGATTFWLLVALTATTGLYSLSRILSVQSSNFVFLDLDPNLRVANLPIAPERRDILGIVTGDRVIEVNGSSVADLSEYKRGLRQSRDGATQLVLQKQTEGERKHFLYLVQPRHPVFSVDSGGGIVSSRFGTLEKWDLSLGDRIMSVNGSAVAGPEEIGRDESLDGPMMDVRIDRSGRGLPSLELCALLLDPRVSWIHFLLGTAFSTFGAVVYRIKPARRTSWGFFIFCIYAGIFYFLRGIPSLFKTSLEYRMFLGLLNFAVFPLLFLVGTYTPMRRFVSGMRRLLLFALAVGTTVSLLHLALEDTIFFAVWGACLLGLLLAMSFMDKLLIPFGFAIEPIDRQRSNAMRLALSLAFGPNLLYLVFRMATKSGAGMQCWFELTPFIFPVVISYAIVRQNFLSINELLIEGLVFGTLMLAVASSYGLMIGSVVPLLDALRPGLTPWAVGAVTGVLAGGTLPIYVRVRRALERHYERQQARYDDLIQAIEREGGSHPTLQSYCAELVEKLRRLTETPDVCVLAYVSRTGNAVAQIEPPTGRLEVVAQSVAEMRDMSFAGEMPTPLISLLERRPEGIYREEFDDAIQKGEVGRPLADMMARLHAIMLFPIIVENHLTALLTLGNKVNCSNYSQAEIAKIRHVARCVTVGFYGFAMQMRLREKMKAEEERREIETQLRQAQKLEAVGTLASGIAHDIGNLLTAISGFTSMARTTLPLDHPALESLSNVEEATRQAGGVAKFLLTFAKETGCEKTSVNFGRVVANSLKLLRRFLPASIQLVENIQSSEKTWIHADENQIHQALFNLVLNARDAMPSGGRLTVSVNTEGYQTASDRKANHVWLVVEDTGHGIPDALRQRIFEPFFTTKPASRGSGLGLAITRGIVTDNGGSIEVFSEPDIGTKFVVGFPACASPDTEENPILSSEPNSGAGQIILVAEDNPLVRNLIALRLGDLNYEVAVTGDGFQFMHLYAERGADASLVVLDVDLPGIGGLECLRRIRDKHPKREIILITANPSAEIENMVDLSTLLLRKPFPINILADLISRKLNRAGMEISI